MNSLSLYLHIPFCKEKCKYCDFFSGTCLQQIPSYETALLRHLASLAPQVRQRTVKTVYLGGGTPSLLSPQGLVSIFDELRSRFVLSPDAEITMECNPESCTEEIFRAAKKAGINRISMGMQSADDGELARLGRLHRHWDTVRAVTLAKKIGFENISLDLMYGLPRQNLSSFRRSLEACFALAPKHISFYCLTLSPQVELYRSGEILPGEEECRTMYLAAHAFLAERGWDHYEISNAAFPGYDSRHNRVYWEGGDYIGIGPGAHSLYESKRFFMKEDLDAFCSASSWEEVLIPGENLTDSDRLTEYLMLSCRLREGIDLDRVTQLSDAAFSHRVAEKMTLWSRHGLCRKTEQGFALTPEGFFVSNEIIAELI